ncbi:hypothetical protein MLD38_008496 [Melastoma candidum]|uniref:Uncharacterized protein n=1 Tax=Melastoma candidum TaxID=119954 RepID=A0ACB9RU55_9MYRT|nr:hypothetical protein MLD38_008496 [Melastoma candidum]
MDSRFFGIPRSSRQPAYYYPVPAHRQPPGRSPKVVSIPVHFMEPEPTMMRTRSREELAVKVQAAFRGFVVRKCVKKLDAVRREVEEIERRVCQEEVAELMRRDERERLKVNEALMSLLFRLDSVRGVDAGVRDLRKKVIRKAIALQEKVDAMASAADLVDRKDVGSAEAEKSEEGGIDSPDLPDLGKDDAEADQMNKQVAGGSIDARGEEPALDSSDWNEEGCDEAVVQNEEGIAYALNLKEGCDEAEQREDLDTALPEDNRAEAKQIEESDHVADNENGTCDLIMEMEPSQFESSEESRSDPSLKQESFLEEVDENAPMKEDEETEQAKSTKDKEWEATAEGNDRKADNRSEEMLGRMVEDNEKMMAMMMQLFERNEQQTKLLSLLSQRVERLEKAFLCEKLRRKKKKREATTDGDRLPNSNKCGKKH